MRTTILAIFTATLITTLAIAESSAGLQWTGPAGWTNKGASTMRAATYTVQDSECVVYFFGPGQGGSVDANITRWKGQFTGANGAPPVAKTSKKTINGLAVTNLEVTGTYEGMAGPNMTPQTPKTDARMLAAIVEGPGGNIFLKFTGPVKTIEANRAKFDQLLNSFHKQ